MRHVLSALIGVLLLVQAVPAKAQDRFTPDETFVLGALIHTLYHELAHALIDLYDLPVLGREEDAADAFGAVMMIPDPDAATDFADTLIFSAADAFGLAAELSADDPDIMAHWGEHSFDEQRYASLLCMVYGSDPAGFEGWSEHYALDPEDQDICVDRYEQAREGWATVLEPHSANGRTRHRVQILFTRLNDDSLRGFLRKTRASGLVDDAGARVSRMVDLPHDVLVQFSHCEDPGAFYDPEDQSVTICYELLGEFRQLARMAN